MIDKFGVLEPLVWNETTGNLVGGHQRFKILKDKGLKEVDVCVVVDSAIQQLAPLLAPPSFDRAVNLQEVETMLCKFKSFYNGRYFVGKDIKELKHSLSLADNNQARGLLSLVNKW